MQDLVLRSSDRLDQAAPHLGGESHHAIDVLDRGQAHRQMLITARKRLGCRTGWERQVVRQEGAFERGIFFLQPRTLILERRSVCRHRQARPPYGLPAAERNLATLQVEPYEPV